MNRLTTFLTSIGIGAGLMYFFDPARGDRRRALVRDQVYSLRDRSDDAIDTAMVDLRNRMRGLLAEGMARLSDQETPDWLLEERVRAELGRATSHAGAIEVRADGGKIYLKGPILASEVDYLVRQVSRVRGVKGVENQLEVHESAEGVHGLQGVTTRRRARPEWAQENWSPSMRLLTGVGGTMLAFYGATRKGLIGSALGLAGLGMAARGVTNIDLKSLLGVSDRRDTIRINKAINIDAPAEQLYQFWANYENFPKFMAHIEEVKNLGDGRSHWKARGPAGSTVEWDAITTRQMPNEELAWESVAGSQVQTRGKVQFHENPDGSTRVTVHLHYTPPAGMVGHAVASLLGANPKQAMDDDLARLKSLFERGETTVKGQKLTGQDLAGAAT